ELETLVVLCSGTARLFAQGGVLDAVDRALQRASDRPLPPDPAARNALAVTAQSLSVRYRGAFYHPDWSGPSFSELQSRLDGLVYRFDANVTSLFPVILMSVHNNYSTGVERIAFRAEPDALIAEFVEGEARHRLRLTGNGYAESEVCLRGDVYTARADIQANALGTGEWMLRLNVHFIETPYTRLIEFCFKDDAVTALFDEYPTLSDAAGMLMELAGVTRMQVLRQLMPLLKQERMQNRLRSFTTASIQGRL
ncbi:MAG: hypothetical protein Q4C13_08765, partial [Clostridia bacterium]|nr:hypothetical protein [Clostridia bacterium]